MPPTLDLSKTPTHGSMCLSPRLPLRRSHSYNNLFEKNGPPSATASGFSYNSLLSEPPISPGLPALIPRHGKKLSNQSGRRYVRILTWIFGVAFLLYYAFQQARLNHSVPAIGWSTTDGKTFEMVGDDELPEFPTPLIVADKRGRSKWTVSIPQKLEFPLQPSQYYDICMHSMGIANQVEDLHNHKHKTHAAHYGYYHIDGNYMDVQEAIENKLLPGVSPETGNSIFDNFKEKHLMVGEQSNTLVETPMCERSMTFVLETANAGLGNTLMMLWTAYGLAQKEGRAFFIDDTRWAYGKFINFFQSPPMPACQPPPRHEIVPCPHQARHIAVSAATAPWTFGGGFNEYYEDARKMEVFRQKPIFEFARVGYEALFKLADADREYVMQRIEDLRNITSTGTPESDGIMVGVHVRHGDRHPLEFQYADAYIPLERYIEKANELSQLGSENSEAEKHSNMTVETQGLIVVASDDPEVYETDDFSEAARAQEQIRLATQKTLMGAQEPKPAPPRRSIRGFVEETIGWEGGFYAPMFWSLGTSGKTAADSSVAQAKVQPSQETMRLRELVGRAYLMDLAVLGQSSDRIVCTVSSMTCKLLAVMMGWEASFEWNYWVNIDGDFQWRGVDW